MSGKAITFILSDWDGSGESDGSTSTAPLSYFVLGAARGDSDDPSASLRGDELVDGIAFKDDLRDGVYTGQTYHRDDGASVTTTDASGRATLTGELLTRGGWRDHTDGNRISTTRGDAIDVVYGNYKLVVLGRISKDFDPSGAGGLGDAGNTDVNTTLQHAWFDASGGQISEGTSAEGKIVSSIWKADQQDGSWYSVRQTDNGDRRTVYTGTLARTFYGPTWTNEVGRGTEAISIDSGANTAGAHAPERPDVSAVTRARSISIAEKIHAQTESVSVDGKHAEETRVSDRFEEELVGSGVSTAVLAVTFKEDLMAKTIETSSGAKSFRLEVMAGIGACKVDVIGYRQTATLGSAMTIRTFGLALKAQGPVSVKAFVGLDTDFRLGPSVALTTGSSVRLHATFDLMGWAWAQVVRLFQKKEAVLEGDVGWIGLHNHSVAYVT